MAIAKGIIMENVFESFLLLKNLVAGKSNVANNIAKRMGRIKSLARKSAAQINPMDKRLKLNFL